MQEPNEQTTNPPQPKEICTLRIAFPIVSDAQALKVKSRVASVLSDIPDAQIHFSIIPTPKTGLRY